MRNLLLVLVSACLLSGCIAEALTSGHIAFSDERAGNPPAIGTRERALIREYCARRDFARNLSAEESRMASQLRRYDRLPSRLVFRGLPQQLESRLPPLPQPYARVLVGTDVFVVNRRTRVIADLARGVCEPYAAAPAHRR